MTLISSSKDQVKNINGVRIKIRKDNAAEIDVWIADVYNEEELQMQRQWVLKAASLNPETTL